MRLDQTDRVKPPRKLRTPPDLQFGVPNVLPGTDFVCKGRKSDTQSLVSSFTLEVRSRQTLTSMGRTSGHPEGSLSLRDPSSHLPGILLYRSPDPFPCPCLRVGGSVESEVRHRHDREGERGRVTKSVSRTPKTRRSVSFPGTPPV